MKFLYDVLVVSSLLAVILFASDGMASDFGEEFSVSFKPETLRPGEYGILEFAITKIPKECRIHSMRKIDNGPVPMTIEIKSDAFTPDGPWFARSPEMESDPAYGETIGVYKTPVRHRRVFKLTKDEVGSLELPIKIRFQIDNAGQMMMVSRVEKLRIEGEAGPVRPQYAEPPALNGEPYVEDWAETSNDKALVGTADRATLGSGSASGSIWFSALAGMTAWLGSGFVFLLAAIIGLLALLRPVSLRRTAIFSFAFWSTLYAVAFIPYLTGIQASLWSILVVGGSLLLILALNIVGAVKKQPATEDEKVKRNRPIVIDIGITICGALVVGPLFILSTAAFLGILMVMAIKDGSGFGLILFAFVVPYSIPFVVCSMLITWMQKKGPGGQNAFRITQYVVIVLFIVTGIQVFWNMLSVV